MSDNNIYQYSKITSQGTIRLMQLQPSPDLQAPVHCSIVHESLAKYDNSLLEFYIAVSYVWGDPNIKSTVSVDGERLEITSSLDEALRHIRDGERVLHVWADGVCIDQNDTEDRNLQVSQMGSIYSTAQHTIIFLGAASPLCDHLLRPMAPNILGSQPFITYGKHDSRTPLDLSLAELLDSHILNRPWFSRTWIFQELILSQDPWVQIGTFRIKWLHFSRYILSVPETEWTNNFKRLAQMSEARVNIRRLNESRDPGNQAELLLNLLSSRRGLGVSDPRDVIYAHLGMIGMKTQAFVCSDQSRISTTSYKEEAIAISYDKTVSQVYEDTTRFLLQNVPWVTMLLHIEEVEQSERRQGLPSWVPNWTRQWTPKSPPPDRGNNLDLEDVLRLWEEKCWHSFIISGVLAVCGFEFGLVKAVLHERLLPKWCFQQRDESLRRPTAAQLTDWIQSPTTASNALEALRILIDYHIERIPESSPKRYYNIEKRALLDFNESDPGAFKTLCALLAPLTEKWATADPRNAWNYRYTGKYYIEFLTRLVIGHISMILSQFTLGSGPIALLDSNNSLQAPRQVQVNDCVGRFVCDPRVRTGCVNVILRPEPGKEDLDFHAAMRMALSSSDNVKHFTYVGFCSSLACFTFGRLSESGTPIIFAIH